MSLPATARAVQVIKKGNKFREVTEVKDIPVVKPEPGMVLVRNKYVGINASDILMTAGGYDPTAVPPFTAGLEGIGEVIAIGDGVSLKVGQSVVFLHMGSFAECVNVSAATAIPVESTDPAYLSIVLSGLTASIALQEEADLHPGQKVMVTAAAGGTGQFAVQIAKMAGCHVIGTTSSQEKADFLKSVGCDRVINYRSEDVASVLTSEYPDGVDVVYECVGGEMFDVCLQNLAVKGRLIVIGQISSYQRDDLADVSQTVSKLPVAVTLLFKSASIRSFFLLHYQTEFARHVEILSRLYKQGKLTIALDKGDKRGEGGFQDLETVADAVDHMYARRNIGKIVVEL